MAELFTGSVAVVGLGYIGLPTAVMLATRGIDVTGVDIDPRILNAVSDGEVPFAEPDLAAAMRGAVASGTLHTSCDVPHADAYIIAVPTPFNADHTADLSYVRTATEQVAERLRGGEIVVLESTSPPGTTEQVSSWIAERRPDLHLPHADEGLADVHVAHCPERVLPGRIMVEMVTNDRVVGGITNTCAERAASIYRIFCEGEICLTDAASAEMAKLVENAYRDVNIAFANELSYVSDELELDVWEVIRLANRHPRVNILNPGPGVGGHCIAVDPWFIVGAAPEAAKLIRTAREVNDSKPNYVAQQAIDKCARFRDPTIACLGLTFKADVDDIRESPALQVVELIAKALPDVEILLVDPFVPDVPDTLQGYERVRMSRCREAVAAADIVIELVDHDQFKSLSRSLLAGKVVYDTRGLWR